jgi:CRISPR system Cascade subunit CasA
MTINLITDAWMPARTREGGVRYIRPAEVGDTDLTGLAFPRPDLNGAATEFLIGLLTTAAAPATEEAWSAAWSSSPSPAQLDVQFAAHVPAFDLAKFMQVPLDCDVEPVEGLLLDAAGDKTTREHGDCLGRTGTVEALSPGMAAAALLALQLYTTQGGTGYSVSIRGGGPLTTLVAAGSSLWGRVWPNVETLEQVQARAVGRPASSPFPWMSPIADGSVTPDGADPLLVYWALPRRVQLLFSSNCNECTLTGERPTMSVQECRIKPGTKYEGWTHPLTPYRKSKEEWLPERGQTTRIGFRDWLGLVQSSDEHRPARAVAHARNARWQLKDARLVAYGYASRTALATGWCMGEMPLVVGAHDAREVVERAARVFVDAADHANKALTKAVGAAHGPRVGGSYWEVMEPHFWRALADVSGLAASDADDPALPARQAWAVTLRRCAYECFERACPLDLDHGGNLSRVVATRHRLAQTLRGYGKSGEAFFGALGLAPAGTQKNR